MFSFLKKNKKTKPKMTEFTDFEFTSYLSPWYFKDDIPFIGKYFEWKYFDKPSITKLFYKKNCVGLIDTYCYVKPIDEDRFLIWVRGSTKLELYNAKDLKQIDNHENMIDQLREKKQKYFFNSMPVEKIEYFFDLYQTEIKFDFPTSFQEIDEIIQVNDITGMYENLNQKEINNTAIVVLNPKLNEIKLFPQDWFNLDTNIDFGYQWITRADRNKNTGKIQIQGIRIGEYILDSSNRNLEK